MGNKGAKEALLEYTSQFLRSNVSNELRTQEVLAATKTSFSSLYHHYGSREGLIKQAQIKMIQDVWGQNLTAFQDSVIKIKTFEEFCLFFSSLNHARATSPDFQEGRKIQAVIIGAAFSDPVVQKALIESLQKRIEALLPSFQGLQERGVLNAEVNLADFIGLWISFFASRIFMESDPLTTSLYPDWNRIFLTIFLKKLSPDGNFTWDQKYALRISNPIPGDDLRPDLPKEDIPQVYESYTEAKKRIIDSAISILNHHPLEELTLQKVAEQLDVAPSLVFKYFKDKDQLLNEANKIRFYRMRITNSDSLGALLAVKDPAQLEEIYRALLRSHTYLSPDSNTTPKSVSQVRWEVLSSAVNDPSLKELVIKFNRCVAHAWKDSFQHLQDLALFEPQLNIFALNYFILSTFQAFPLFALSRLGYLTSEETFEVFWSYISLMINN